MFLPLLLEKIFWSWSGSDSLDTTKYIFISYIGFFIILLDILIPTMQKISRFLKLRKVNLVDGVTTIVIILVSLIPLIILRTIIMFWLKRVDTAKYGYKIFREALSITSFLLGTRIRFHGEINDAAKLFPINHSSALDYILMPLCMGTKPYNIIAGKNLSENKKTSEDKIVYWALGKIIEKYSILVDRDDPTSKKAAFFKEIRQIKAGIRIVFSPEEGRLPKSEIKKGVILKDFGELSNGTFFYAFKEEIPIQPIVYDWPVIYRGKGDDWWGVHPCIIDIFYLDVICPTDYPSMEDFKRACFEAMETKLKKSKKVQNFLKELRKD